MIAWECTQCGAESVPDAARCSKCGGDVARQTRHKHGDALDAAASMLNGASLAAAPAGRKNPSTPAPLKKCVPLRKPALRPEPAGSDGSRLSALAAIGTVLDREDSRRLLVAELEQLAARADAILGELGYGVLPAAAAPASAPKAKSALGTRRGQKGATMRERVLSVMRAQQPVTLCDMAKHIGVPQDRFGYLVRAMVNLGEVKRTGEGRGATYALAQGK